MSQQTEDHFVWNKKNYIFICASDIYELFDPNAYGLNPIEPDTSCWKGFVIHFLVKEKQLYINKLEVNCEDDIYPNINGITAKCSSDRFHVYNKLRMPIKYTGTIIIGKHINNRFRGHAFVGPHSYAETYELEFKHGQLVDYHETSGSYYGF